MMYAHAVLVTLALILAPLGARAADLVVWWEEGYYAQEDEAVREIIAAFEEESGKQVELALHPLDEHSRQDRGGASGRSAARFRHSALTWSTLIPRWALNDRLVDLTGAVGHFADLFDPPRALVGLKLVNEKAGQTALYALPMGRVTNHVHVWKSLLEQAGFTLADIPRKDWDAFWSFWCDQVQPAVRRVTGRDDIWGVGLPHVGRARRGSRLSSLSSWLPTMRTT